MTTLDDTYQILKQIRDDLPALLRQIQVAPVQIVTIEGLSDISKRLGLVQAGEFRSGNGLEPGFGFSGVRIGYPAFSYNSELWNIAGVENDVLQVGIKASDGKFYAAAGDVFIDDFGINLKNQEGLIAFQDLTTGTYDNVTIYINSGDTLVLQNAVGGKAVGVDIDTATHNVLQFTFMESATAEVAEFQVSGINGAHILLGSGVSIWANKDGTETVFNESSHDIDERHEGATDINLWKLDAGLDRIGIGVAVPGYKLDVNGDVNVATGSTFKVNGVTVISGTITGVTNGDSHDHAGGDGAAITDANLSTSDITTNNATSSKHGFLPKLSNVGTELLNGLGSWVSKKSAMLLIAHALGDTVAASTTEYIAPNTNVLSTTQNTCLVTMAGTLNNFYVRTGSAQPASGKLDCTVQINGVDTAITFSIAAGAAAGNYSDTSNSVSVAAADRISFKFVNNATGVSATVGSIILQYNVAFV